MPSLVKSARSRLRWLLLAPIPLAWCVVAHLGMLKFLEDKVVDMRFHFRGPINSPAKVAYVDVDSRSVEVLGQTPWNRAYFADVGSAVIKNGGAKAVGMDFVFSEGLPMAFDEHKLIAGNRALGSFLWHTHSVIVAASYTAAVHEDEKGNIRIRSFPYVFAKDLPPLRQIDPPETPEFNIGRGSPFQPAGVGLIDTVGGEVRMVPLYAQTSVRTYYSMGVELARVYYGVEPDGMKIQADTLDLVRPDGSTATSIPMRDHQLLEINWFSKWLDTDRNPHISFSEVYAASQLMASADEKERKAGEDYFKRPDVSSILNGAVVLIGPTDKLMQDIAPTPMDETSEPRVAVHGNVFKTIVARAYLKHLPEWGGFAAIVLLAALITFLAITGGGRAVFAKVMAVMSAVIYVAAAFELFTTANLIIPVVAPLGAAVTTSVVGLLWQIVEERKQKGRIKGMFGTYVSPAVVESMVNSGEDPKLGGVEANITAYFSDIQSFSSFSEKLSPTLLVELMNQYLTVCTDSIQGGGGTLDKYIGDAVVAIYGAPLSMDDHAGRACVAALKIHKQVSDLRNSWIAEGDKWPEIVHNLQTRIGLNSGPAVVGNMGSTTRFSYTMMGDNVNIAARMESGAKSWGVYTMCTEATRTECEAKSPGKVLFRALGRIIVKGRKTPLPIYELAALSEDATPALKECIAIFEQGMAKYYARDWDGAIELFRKSEPLEPNGVGRARGSSNNPSLVYISIAEGYRAEPPPPDWDGVFEMKEK